METANSQSEPSSPMESGSLRRGEESREDARLLAAITARDSHALAELYQRRGRLIYSLLVRMLVNEMEAQEVMQDTFVHIWRSAAGFDPARSSPLAWMIMIARGRALDRLRARSRRTTRHAEYENEMAAREQGEAMDVNPPESGELAAACNQAMRSLPEPQERALRLAFFQGWTHEEIAGALGEPLGTVKARIRRGLLALRQALKDHHG